MMRIGRRRCGCWRRPPVKVRAARRATACPAAPRSGWRSVWRPGFGDRIRERRLPLPFFGAGQAHHGLPGGDDLAGFGEHGGDDARMLAAQRAVAALVGADFTLRARLGQPTLAALWHCPGVEGGLADEFARQQASLPLAFARAVA